MEQGKVNKWCAPILAIGLALSVNMVSAALAVGNDQDYSDHFAEKAKNLQEKMSESFTAERLDSVSRAPADDVVHVYYNPSDVKQPFEAVGLITVNYEKGGQWNLSHETKLIDKVIRRARELGANGLILKVSQPQSSGPVSMRGTAIVFK